jgi:uncharacterized protein YjbI with pentapeptide repeats
MDRLTLKTTPAPKQPRIQRNKLHTITEAELFEDALFEDFLLKENNFAESNARDVRFLTGIIDRARFDRTKLLQPKIVDVSMEGVHLSNAQWETSACSRMIITNAKLTGFRATHGIWTDVSIEDTKADLSLFILIKLKNVTFKNCILNDVTFQECEMENVRFQNCDLTNAMFPATHFKSVDFRGSKFQKTVISTDQFRGIIIEPPQASYLIGATGATVAWLDE